jgi:hypothetical protein
VALPTLTVTDRGSALQIATLMRRKVLKVPDGRHHR